MALKDQLSKMKMPNKSMAEQEAEMDLGLEEMDELSEEGEEMEDEEMTEEGLGGFSDDEIIEEMKLRGLELPLEDEELAMEDMEDEEDEGIDEPEMLTGQV